MNEQRLPDRLQHLLFPVGVMYWFDLQPLPPDPENPHVARFKCVPVPMYQHEGKPHAANPQNRTDIVYGPDGPDLPCRNDRPTDPG